MLQVVAAGMACNITPAAARRYLPHPDVRFVAINDHPGSALAVAHRAHLATPFVTAFVEVATTVRDHEAGIVAAIEGRDEHT